MDAYRKAIRTCMPACRKPSRQEHISKVCWFPYEWPDLFCPVPVLLPIWQGWMSPGLHLLGAFGPTAA